ncbi:MAG: indole-3-glycerol phosphate synthase TrpC [Solirubrobacterales bacterium]|nr:indole-3-glycerol phosphate synthase TrpC [Solirubrobacterales bacterium]
MTKLSEQPTFLSEILELKNLRLITAKTKISAEEIKEKAFEKRKKFVSHRLREELRNTNQLNIIAEFKRASPSKGIINDKNEVADVVCAYEQGGACAVSILTEEDRFQGSLEDLRRARETISLPILRKDFVFEEFQIYESAANGADAILLIAAMLDDKNLIKFHRLAEEELGLDALVEVHTLDELKRVKKIGAKIIGVNNRDLHSFNVSLDVSRELIKHAPKDSLMISESGLKTREDILELKKIGFKGFLIGETLMRSENISQELRQLATNKHEKARIT